MTKITTSKGEFLFAPVQQGEDNFEVLDQKLHYDTQEIKDDYDLHYVINVDTEFIATTDTITEDQSAQIVGDNGMGCWDNYRLKKDNVYTCKSAIQSFKCLIETSLLTGRYAILKIVK